MASNETIAFPSSTSNAGQDKDITTASADVKQKTVYLAVPKTEVIAMGTEDEAPDDEGKISPLDAVQSHALLSPSRSEAVLVHISNSSLGEMAGTVGYNTVPVANLNDSTAELAQLERVVPPNTTVQQIPLNFMQKLEKTGCEGVSSHGHMLANSVNSMSALAQSQNIVSTTSHVQPMFMTTPEGQLVKLQAMAYSGQPLSNPGLQSPAVYQVVVNTPKQQEATSSTKQGAVGATKDSKADEKETTAVMSPDSNTKHSMTCKVCGDKASGYHYGVTSCEGCKGFFRRSIQKRIEYRCLRDGSCVVIRLNRNRCQYCRFKKCVAVGMSRDFRIHGKASHRRASTEASEAATSNSSNSTSGSSTNKPENYYLAVYDIILNISQAHHSNCAYTEDKIKSLQPKAISLLPDSHIGTSVEEQRLAMWQELSGHITGTIQMVVEFAKRLPGFSEITQDDQLILIKCGFFELWLIRISRTVSSTNRLVMFGDGSVISQDQLELIFTPELVKSMFDFANGLNQLALNDTEIGLLCGMVLSTSDRPGLQTPAEVEQIQDRLIEALKLQLSRNHSSEPNLFANIVMRLPELRTISTIHNEVLQWYRQNWSGLSMPPLFAEIYDFPKNDSTTVQT